jgi:hypothetical protein
MKDLDSLTMDAFHGILMAYEMRTKKEKTSNKEVSFKASKKKNKGEHESSDSLDNESEVEEAHLVSKLKKGSGKYKGKLSFKCFNYGKVGNFVAKCPYAKNESSDDEEDHNIKKERKPHQKGKCEKKRKFHK